MNGRVKICATIAEDSTCVNIIVSVIRCVMSAEKKGHIPRVCKSKEAKETNNKTCTVVVLQPAECIDTVRDVERIDSVGSFRKHIVSKGSNTTRVTEINRVMLRKKTIVRRSSVSLARLRQLSRKARALR